MAGIKIVNLPALGRNLASTDLFELSLAGGTGSRKITGQEIINGIPLPPSGITIGTTAITSGTVGRVLFEGTGNVVQESANITWNNTTNRFQIIGDAVINTLYIGLGGGQGATNTAVGVTALNANTTGVSNTAFGFETLLLNSTGSGNTAIGRKALRATTGASNIGIGNSSMENNTSGGSNISIGEGAGNVNTTGSSNIFIGNWSTGVVNNASNRTWIGNTATTSTYIAGNVLINTTTDAGFKLDVNGNTRIVGQVQFSSGSNIGFRSSGLYSAFGYNTNEENNVALKVGFGTGTSINTLLKIDNTVNNTAAGPTTVLLDILANVSQTANLVQWRNSAGAILGVINSAGNVGIGTSTPARRLTVLGNNSATAVFRIGNTSFGGQDTATLEFGHSTDGGNLISSIRTLLPGDATSQLRFSTSGAFDALTITGAGNVLIGTTTNAGFKLDVNGTARVQGDVTVTGTRISISNAGMSIDANVGTGYYNIRNNSGSAGTTAITLGGNTYLNIYQPISASSGITAGTLNTITTPLTYAWASGTASPNLFQLNPNYNFTGTYTGTARGFYYNPTLTSIVGLTHFAFHSTSGRVRFEGLPTSPAGLNAGDLYNNLGVLMIV